jgi:hypothetical protein
VRRALAVVAVVVGAFAIGTWWAMPSGGDAAAGHAEATGDRRAAGDASSERATSSPRPAELGVHLPADRADHADAHPRSADSEIVDPCTAVVDPVIPPAFDQQTADGITVAVARDIPTTSPYDHPVRATAIAKVASALLDEAADDTGTAVRPSLVVIVYASRDDFRVATHAPAWAAGLYDGGVELPVSGRGDLGVDMQTLRHEVMHAQLHHAVGCMPIWLNEGLAMVFAGETPARGLIRLVAEHEPIEVDAFGVSSFEALHGDHSSSSYPQFLAMTLVMLDSLDERQAIASLLAMAPARRVGAWHQLSKLDGRGTLDALAWHVFGTHDVAPLLAAPLCCSSLRSPRDLRCHPAPAHDSSEHIWVDHEQSPPALCDTQW